MNERQLKIERRRETSHEKAEKDREGQLKVLMDTAKLILPYTTLAILTLAGCDKKADKKEAGAGCLPKDAKTTEEILPADQLHQPPSEEEMAKTGWEKGKQKSEQTQIVAMYLEKINAATKIDGEQGTGRWWAEILEARQDKQLDNKNFEFLKSKWQEKNRLLFIQEIRASKTLQDIEASKQMFEEIEKDYFSPEAKNTILVEFSSQIVSIIKGLDSLAEEAENNGYIDKQLEQALTLLKSLISQIYSLPELDKINQLHTEIGQFLQESEHNYLRAKSYVFVPELWRAYEQQLNTIFKEKIVGAKSLNDFTQITKGESFYWISNERDLSDSFFNSLFKVKADTPDKIKFVRQLINSTFPPDYSVMMNIGCIQNVYLSLYRLKEKELLSGEHFNELHNLLKKQFLESIDFQLKKCETENYVGQIPLLNMRLTEEVTAPGFLSKDDREYLANHMTEVYDRIKKPPQIIEVQPEE